MAATHKRNRFLERTWEKTDYIYIIFMAVMHGLCLLAPATFSWPMVGLFCASYFVTGCGSSALFLLLADRAQDAGVLPYCVSHE